MLLTDILDKIRPKLAYAAGFNARVLFDLGEDGFVHVDATQTPPEITAEEKEADVTLEVSASTLLQILDGTMDPNMAFLMRKLKIRGNMGLAMKLNAFLEG